MSILCNKWAINYTFVIIAHFYPFLALCADDGSSEEKTNRKWNALHKSQKQMTMACRAKFLCTSLVVVVCSTQVDDSGPCRNSDKSAWLPILRAWSGQTAPAWTQEPK